MEPEIERAHRVGPTTKRNGSRLDRQRTIVCKLLNWKMKESSFKAARRVKPEGLYVSEDLAEETVKRRNEQLGTLRKAKRQGKIAYFVLDKLVIKPRRRRLPLQDEAAENNGE